jgi:hypothetical protein
MAGIRFSFTPDTKELIVELTSSASEIIHYKTQIKRLEEKKLRYYLTQASLVEILQSMQQGLSGTLKIYYPNRDPETFDDAVKSMIAGLTGPVSPTFMEEITIKKAYAKYYYEMFKNKLIQIDEKHSDALILSSLVSYYFIKRLVHVFVMCTIYEKVSVPTTTATANASQGATFVINNNEQSTDFTAERNALQAKILALETAMKNSETTSSASLNTMTEINTLNTALLNKAEDKIKILENQVNNYRELLLKSTTMIFKLDEIPNVVLSSK